MNTLIQIAIYVFYLYTAFVKRIIHKLMCSNALFLFMHIYTPNQAICVVKLYFFVIVFIKYINTEIMTLT